MFDACLLYVFMGLLYCSIDVAVFLFSGDVFCLQGWLSHSVINQVVAFIGGRLLLWQALISCDVCLLIHLCAQDMYACRFDE